MTLGKGLTLCTLISPSVCQSVRGREQQLCPASQFQSQTYKGKRLAGLASRLQVATLSMWFCTSAPPFPSTLTCLRPTPPD